MTAPAPFEANKLIRFHHCDPAGIVFYPQYFVLFNELVEDWFNDGLGVDFGKFHAVDRLGVPMAHIECDFLSPSKVGELLRFRLAVKKIGVSSLTLDVDARAGEQPRVRATLVVVLASLDTRQSVPFPAGFRAKIARFEV
ncbi:MAG: thioesterase family protein [Casimicrobiaceae bacterium]